MSVLYATQLGVKMVTCMYVYFTTILKRKCIKKQNAKRLYSCDGKSIKEKIWRPYCIKFFNVCIIKDPETKIKRHALIISIERKKSATDWNKVYATCIIDKGLTLEYLKLLQNKQMQNITGNS